MCNYGEVFGPGCYFTADGSFAPVDGVKRCPKDFTVAIEQVAVAVVRGDQEPCSVRVVWRVIPNLLYSTSSRAAWCCWGGPSSRTRSLALATYACSISMRRSGSRL